MRLKQHYECDAIENPVIEIENYRNEKKKSTLKRTGNLCSIAFRRVSLLVSPLVV